MIRRNPINILEAKAMDFHTAHPEVWELFVRFTRDRIARGFQHYSAQSIFERIRWETDTPGEVSADGFKLNNNHVAYYSRWFTEEYPEYDGFFRRRTVVGEAEDV